MNYIPFIYTRFYIYTMRFNNIKNWISFINEGKIQMDKHTFNKICSEEHLDKYFNINLDDIQDIVQDVLDENTYLSCCVNIWDENKFVIKFYIDSDIST